MKPLKLSRKKLIRAISKYGTINTHDSVNFPPKKIHRGFANYNVLPTETLEFLYRAIVLGDKTGWISMGDLVL